MTIHHCIVCNAPLSGATRLCSACAEAALATFEAYQEGDTEPNATDWVDDCGYDLDAGFCDLDGSEECLLCPYRQAIGDTAS